MMLQQLLGTVYSFSYATDLFLPFPRPQFDLVTGPYNKVYSRIWADCHEFPHPPERMPKSHWTHRPHTGRCSPLLSPEITFYSEFSARIFFHTLLGYSTHLSPRKAWNFDREGWKGLCSVKVSLLSLKTYRIPFPNTEHILGPITLQGENILPSSSLPPWRDRKRPTWADGLCDSCAERPFQKESMVTVQPSLVSMADVKGSIVGLEY